MRQIIQNEVQCNACEDIVFSSHRHDFKSCKCGAISVDGGMDYLRRVGAIMNYTDRSMEMEQKDLDACITAIKWAKDTKRDELGTALAVVRALRDAGLLNEKRLKAL